jgi:hypothetical protein
MEFELAKTVATDLKLAFLEMPMLLVGQAPPVRCCISAGRGTADNS